MTGPQAGSGQRSARMRPSFRAGLSYRRGVIYDAGQRKALERIVTAVELALPEFTAGERAQATNA
jgi:hypothetical protein